MKRKSSLVPFIALLLLGCARNKHEASKTPSILLHPVPPVEAFALSWQKPVPAGGLTLTLQKTEDSRCPKDAKCVWAGMAVAYVQVQDAQGESVSKTLHLGDIVNVELGTKTYQLTLRDIIPYPTATNLNPLEKTARISVKPL